MFTDISLFDWYQHINNVYWCQWLMFKDEVLKASEPVQIFSSDYNYPGTNMDEKLPGRKNSGQVIISILISISIFNSNTSLIVFHLYIFSSVYYSSFFNLIFYLENEWTEARVSWHAVPLQGQLGAALQSLSRCRSKLTLSSSFALQQPFGIYLLSHAVDFVDSEHENSSGTLLKCLFGLQTVCPRRTGSLGASIPNNLQ